jgi:hypothetical protein
MANKKISAAASKVQGSKKAACVVTKSDAPAATQMEKSLARAIKKQNAGIGKGPKTLGSTRNSELKKLKDLNKKRSGKKLGSKKAVAKPPAAGSLPFLTYQNAVDVALFHCPGKYLDAKEVREFVNKTFKETGHDNSDASQKKLLEKIAKVLSRGVEEQGDSSVRYNAIVAPAGDGSVLRLIFKYKLDPKHRARVTAGINFQPIFPKDFDSTLVKEFQSKKTFVVPAYHKRSSKAKTNPAETTDAASVVKTEKA